MYRIVVTCYQKSTLRQTTQLIPLDFEISTHSFCKIPFHTNSMNTFSTFQRKSISLLFISQCLLIVSLLGQSPLSGTFTIGGSNPDYATFTEAIDSLNSLGVNGSVIFDVRTASYLEQLVIPAISGASATNTITFRSESGDSSDVVLSWFGSDTDNYTLKMDGASWFRFERMTLQSTNSTYGRVVEMTGGASHNRFSHNFFEGANISSTSTLRTIVYSSSDYAGGTRESYNRFDHNYFFNGSYAIYFQGNGTSPGQTETGNSFEDNLFESYYYRGLYLVYQDSLEVNRNTFLSAFGSASLRSVYLSYCYQMEVQLNVIEQDDAYAFYANNCEGDSLNHSLIANNTISIGGSATFGYGLYMGNCANLDIYHNSVNSYGSGSDNFAFYYQNQGSHERVLNNIFAYTGVGSGYAYYSPYAEFPDSSDYNDFFTNSDVLAHASMEIPDMDAFRMASGNELHSVSGNPVFTSPTDLHVNKALLNAAGASGTGISTDFEGDARGIMPDIGADEFAPTGLDVAMTYFAYPQPPFGAGNYSLRAGFTNLTSTPLVSAQIYLEINGVVEPVYNWSGTLAQGQSDTLNLGTFTFSPNTAYSLRTWITNPNLGTDVDNTDDSIHVQNISTALAGTYTIGGTSPDFATFTDAVNSLNGGGVADTVVFRVRSGTYDEQLVINDFIGGGCNGFPVYIQSESGDSSDVVLEFAANSSDNFTLKLNGADHVIFQGIGFKATGTSYTRVVEVSQGAHCNQFLNCHFWGRDITSTSNRYVVIFSDGGSPADIDSSNVFRNCRIEEGSYGVYWQGYSTFNESMGEPGNVFENNVFVGQRGTGIYMTDQDAAVVRANQFVLDSFYQYSSAIQLSSAIHAFRIENNIIRGSNGGTGIYLSNCLGSPNHRGIVANNFISIRGDANGYGINLNYSDSLDIVFNNVLINNDPGNEGFALQDNASFVNDVHIFNNNFINTGSGFAVDRQSGSLADYNNYFSRSAFLAKNYGTNLADLSGWQQATGQDSHSISTDPLYLSDDDLHVRKGALDSAGISMSGISLDIDGQSRSNPPDIGADEFMPMGLDAGLTQLEVPQAPFVPGNYPVEVILKNTGFTPLDSANIHWMLNGQLQSPVKWYGRLAARQTDSLLLGNVSFTDAQFTDIRAWVGQPNGIIDVDASDDTVEVLNIIPALAGTYTLGGSGFDFLNFNQAFIALQNGGITDTVTFMVRPGTYTEQLILSAYPGASCERPVSFRGESGDAQDVLLTYEAQDFDKPYTLKLDHPQGMHFQHLTFEGTDPSYAQVFSFENGCQCLSLKDNIFKGSVGTSSTYYRTLLYGQSNFNELDSAIYIQNNQFLDGSNGISLNGNSQDSLSKDILIQQNILSNQPGSAIELYGVNHVMILENEISSMLPSSYFMGITVGYLTDGLQLNKNKISRSEGGYGIYLDDVTTSGGPLAMVSNNFISLRGGDENYGIYAFYADSVQIFHNSVWVNLQDPDYTYAFFGEDVTDLWVKNNLFINTGGGYAEYIDGPQAPVADYNDLYTNGQNLGFYGTELTDLAAWQAATGRDSNSVSINPVFSTFGDLHLISGFLNNLGTPLPQVIDDIDGESRDPAHPDLGADEFSPVANEAGLLSLVSPLRPFAAGNSDIQVVLYNNGSQPLTSVRIELRVDSLALPATNWTGNLASGDSMLVNLGTFNFEVGNPYHVKAWTSLPNGMADVFAANDTVQRDSLYPSLAGYYTVGGANPDFLDLTEAIDILNLSGVADAVFFNIRTDTLRGYWTIGEIQGASDSSRITFQAESGDSSDVVLANSPSGSSDNFVIQIDGGDYISLRHLTFLPENASYTRLLYLTNDAKHIRVEQCAFLNLPSNSSSNLYASVYATGSGNDSLNFNHNYFSSGNYGLYISGSTTPGFEAHHNRFVDQSYAGIYLSSQVAPQVTNNDFRTTVSYVWRGIYLISCTENFLLSQNQLRATQGDYGFYISSCQGGVLNRADISNNYIQLTHTGNITNTGIYHTNSSFIDYTYNTIRVTSNSASNRALYLVSGSNTELKNNILAAMNRGYAIYQLSGSVLTASDNNDLYAAVNNVGYLGSAQSTLADWQTASGFDAHSISMDPVFLNDSSFQARATALNGGASPVSGILLDIENDVRNALTPDIGADEFEPIFPNDIGISGLAAPKPPFAAGSQPIQLLLRNHGSDTVTSATIGWQINAINQTSYNWSGSLIPGETDTVTVASYNFLAGQGYDLRAWTSSPNGVSDTLPSNDTLEVYDLYPALDGVYTVGGINPDFTSLPPAIEALNKGGILGTVTLNLRAGTYPGKIELGKILGASASQPVTIQSENGDSSQVHLTQTAAGNTFYLNGTQYLTLRGLHIAATPGLGNARALYLDNRASHNQIENCLLTGAHRSNPGNFDAVVWCKTNAFNGQNQDNHFVNNRIVDGSYGIWSDGYSTSYPGSGLRIENNEFVDQSYGAIWVELEEAPRVHGNRIQSQLGRPNYIGIKMDNCPGAFELSANHISGLEDAKGIYIYSGTRNSLSKAQITNNFVQIGGTGKAYGIESYYSNYLNFYHNSVHITSTDQLEGRAFADNAGSSIELINNNFYNEGGGYALYFGSISSPQLSNTNNYISTGSSLIYRAGTIYPTLVNWRGSTGKDLLSVSVDPFFMQRGEPAVRNARLDSAATVLTGVTTDIAGDARNATHPDIGADEFDLPQADVGVLSLLAPPDGCGLSAAETIGVRIANYGSKAQSDFAVAYRIDGGAVVVDTVRATVAPGALYDFSFSQTADLSVLRTYQIDAFSILPGDVNIWNDSMLAVNLVHIPNLSQPVNNMLPADGTSGLDIPLAFSWSPAIGALTYDVFIWADSLPQPATPKHADISQITFLDSIGLAYGTGYKWQVVAKNGCSSFAGPIQQFSMRTLPDLVVDTVLAPPTAFSGQAVNLNWTIKNEGTFSTGATQWIDAVYLSDDAVFDILSDTYLGGVANFSSLSPGQSYVQNASLTLPVGIAGNYYFFILADGYKSVIEANEGNNFARHITSVTVSLTPPPDLQVSQVVAPLTAFSGQNVNLNYTVTNEGTGNTSSGGWGDWVYLSQDPVLNVSNATLLGKRRFNGLLEVDSSYQNATSFLLPQGIFGTYYFHVVTDAKDEEFEFVFESNNTTASDTCRIYLTPPPDLVVSFISAMPDISTDFEHVFRYHVKNQGGSVAGPTWQDRYFLSEDSIFDPGTDLPVGIRNITYSLGPGDSIPIFPKIRMPNNVSGPRYLFVQTDRSDVIYEYSFEHNNVSRSNLFHIISPDLVPSRISYPDTTTTGMLASFGWTDKNLGPGGMLFSRWKDALSISRYPVYDPDSVIELMRVAGSGALGAGDSSHRGLSMLIPNGLSGEYYVYVNSDVEGKVFEAGQEGNNVIRSSGKMYIHLAPWPDLTVRNVQLPDTIRAGDTVPMSFTIVNQGLASTFGSGFVTRAFFQVDSAWNPLQAKEIASVSYSRVLAPGDSVSFTVPVSMPMLSLVVAGLDSFTVAPVFIHVDDKNEIYEHTDEDNNRVRSDSFYIFCPPPVDLVVEQAAFPFSNLNSGDPASVSWSVRNISSTTAYWKYPFWYDGIFLSKDTIWDGFSDVFVTDWVHPGPLGMNQAYSDAKTFNLPNGISGAYYVFMVADHTNLNRDGNPDNNAWLMRDLQGQPKVLNVTLSPSPDLEPTLFIAPQNGTAGQPIDVIWRVNNRGLGATQASSWTDQIYLSTDFNIDANDTILGTQVHNSFLNPGQFYQDTLAITLPTSASGNYILLFKTDVNNVLYEHQAENNNIVFAYLVVYRPPPSDLIVKAISVPDSVLAGDTTTIRWTLKNQGNNPAAGIMTDAVYLSSDTTWDVGDALFGLLRENINLAPQATVERSLNEHAAGLAIGDYHVIIRTDILDNIIEKNDTNNLAFSADKMQVMVEELPLNSWKSNTLCDDIELYYRLEIPANLAGETLLIDLKGDSVNGSNALYLRRNAIPDRVTYDFTSILPQQSGNQQLVVPSLQAGTYYLLAYGNTANGNKQNVSLFARILNFEIRRIDANKGGNTGSVTVKVEGAKFNPALRIQLEDSGRVYRASSVYYIDPVSVYATFNLRGAALGFYDVVGIQTGDTTRLVDGFEVETGDAGSNGGAMGGGGSGSGGGGGSGGIACTVENVGYDNLLVTTITHPATSRLNRIVPITIHYANQGNVDIPVPYRFLISLEGAPLSFDVTQLNPGFQELILEFSESNGPPGILRPGATGAVTVYTQATAPLRFRLLR